MQKPHDICLKVAKQIGWDGQGCYYQFILDHLPEVGLGSTGGSLLDRVADFMGWDAEYEEECKTKQRFVDKYSERAFDYHKKVILTEHKRVNDQLLETTTQLDLAKNQLLEIKSELETTKQHMADSLAESSKALEAAQIEIALLKDAASQAKSG